MQGDRPTPVDRVPELGEQHGQPAGAGTYNRTRVGGLERILPSNVVQASRRRVLQTVVWFLIEAVGLGIPRRPDFVHQRTFCIPVRSVWHLDL